MNFVIVRVGCDAV